LAGSSCRSGPTSIRDRPAHFDRVGYVEALSEQGLDLGEPRAVARREPAVDDSHPGEAVREILHRVEIADIVGPRGGEMPVDVRPFEIRGVGIERLDQRITVDVPPLSAARFPPPMAPEQHVSVGAQRVVADHCRDDVSQTPERCWSGLCVCLPVEVLGLDHRAVGPESDALPDGNPIRDGQLEQVVVALERQEPVAQRGVGVLVRCCGC